MAQAQKPNQPSLSDVLEPRVLIPALEESPELAAALLEHLPQGDQSVQGLREVLRSPQLAQAVGQLDHVLQSGQGRELTSSFGLGFGMGSQGPAAVAEMLASIQEQEDKNRPPAPAPDPEPKVGNGQGTKRPREEGAAVGGVSITRTDAEALLFDTLQEIVSEKKLGCTLRVAGGWVRDKLMGGAPHDIDIAVDDRMGKELAEIISAYMHEKGRAADVGSVGVIQSNPEQSKHLETATMRLLGFEVDFVNLRAEEYTDSRIPVARVGTPLEDAERRDLTINALFYNLATRNVEDFTGKGMADLKAGIVRTPLPPLSTMTDDPLRALRAIRFATRLGFALDTDLEATLGSAQVSDALSNKVSKERVYNELNGMLNGKDPARALQLLHQLNLLAVVFASPPAHPPPTSWADRAMRMVDRLVAVDRATAIAILGATQVGTETSAMKALSQENRRIAFLSAVLCPLSAITIPQGKKTVGLPESVLRNSLKATTKDVNETALLLEQLPEIRKIARLLAGVDPAPEGEGEPSLKVRAGRALRKCGAMSRLAILLSLCAEQSEADDDAEAGRSAARHSQLVSIIEGEWGLDEIWTMRPLLTGNEITEILKLDKKKRDDGILIGVAMKASLDWILEQPRPKETSKEDCIAWLNATYSKKRKFGEE